ncbi:MAG TPA: hypothetical protein PKZ97_09770 [Azospirillaceae bacterium]|nr:hypothetical protein [Azospirillaceae bacterium]HRQ81394.1 hypothetical protein [Azospirillaceae bacterium]
MSKSHYELHVRRDGRWRIDAAFDAQESAELAARAEISAHGAEEVKVLKYRPFAGFEVEVCVFHRKASDSKDDVVMLGGGAEGAPICRDVSDLYKFESRVVAGRLLRLFLDKHRITVSELLHGWSYARRLDEQGGLLRAAMAAVARWQHDNLGVDAKERTRALTEYADQILSRLRAFNVARKNLAPLEWRDLDRCRRRVALDVGDGDGDFFFMAQVTESLQGANGALAKLEMLLDPWEEAGTDQTALLLEAFIADALGGAEVVRELLGPQPNLAAGLATLADLLFGRPPALDGAPVNPALTRIGRMVVEGRAPQCRAMLIERIRSSLASDQPLDRRNPQGDAPAIGMLEQRLLGPDGRMIGGAEVAKALTRRAVRHRQSLLRGYGLHDVADAAGAQSREAEKGGLGRNKPPPEK